MLNLLDNLILATLVKFLIWTLSNMPIFSKVFEKILAQKMINFIIKITY